MRVLIHFGDGSTSYGVSPKEAAALLEKGLKTKCDFLVPETNSLDELKRLLKTCDVLVGTSNTLDEETCRLFDGAENLKLVQCIGAGIENIPLKLFEKTNAVLADASGSNSIAVAEHAFALILAISKTICEKDRELKRGGWSRTQIEELDGKTHLILGLGAIGTELAMRSTAFKMKVVGIRKHPAKRPELPDCEVFGIGDLRRLLPIADYVSVTLPLTAETRGMIGEAEFGLMKKTASIIMVSRAAIVNEKALYDALSQRRISHAGIDTWYAFPPKPGAPSEYGIQKLENVVATPHIAGITTQSVARVFDIVRKNIDSLAAGGELMNVVDLKLGY